MVSISDINKVRINLIYIPEDLRKHDHDEYFLDGHITAVDAYRGIEVAFISCVPSRTAEFSVGYIFIYWDNITTIEVLKPMSRRRRRDDPRNHPWESD